MIKKYNKSKYIKYKEDEDEEEEGEEEDTATKTCETTLNYK